MAESANQTYYISAAETFSSLQCDRFIVATLNRRSTEPVPWRAQKIAVSSAYSDRPTTLAIPSMEITKKVKFKLYRCGTHFLLYNAQKRYCWDGNGYNGPKGRSTDTVATDTSDSTGGDFPEHEVTMRYHTATRCWHRTDVFRVHCVVCSWWMGSKPLWASQRRCLLPWIPVCHGFRALRQLVKLRGL
jgi:hypothetical protein